MSDFSIGSTPSINTMMSDAQRTQTEMLVDAYNKSIPEDRRPDNVLDKDDFLKILMVQLQNQDPTEPMKDKEFIAQMAQFSSLEQMTNMSRGFQDVSRLLGSSQALGTLGKEVVIQRGSTTVTGRVEEVTNGDFPQVLVNGNYYDYSEIQSVKELEA